MVITGTTRWDYGINLTTAATMREERREQLQRGEENKRARKSLPQLRAVSINPNIFLLHLNSSIWRTT